MTESKPCPFCGENNVSVIEGSSYRYVVARCNSCEAQAGEVRVRMVEGTRQQGIADAEERALAEWNTRTQYS